MVSPMPKYRYRSVLDITVEDLRKMGVKAVALDIDNTICNDGKTNCIDGLDLWLKETQESGIKVMIISNAMPRRPKIVSKALGLPYIASAKKPMPHTLVQGADMMGVEINEFAMVGDQIFADVMAANACGAISILVDALPGKTRFPIFYATRRRKSAPIIKEFEKTHGYGYYD
ncbi:MAG: YqeG family HAD IIIA-type phosphatase [Clostridia bacterium]|nr:YqeG family HAD IIIA-type phosphatase [Clostridia bacterium]